METVQRTFEPDADTIPWRHHLHSILGQVLAGSSGLLLMGWHEPHSPRDVATAVQLLDRHRVAAPRPLLVPLPHGVPTHVLCIWQTWHRHFHPSSCFLKVLVLIVMQQQATV